MIRAGGIIGAVNHAIKQTARAVSVSQSERKAFSPMLKSRSYQGGTVVPPVSSIIAGFRAATHASANPLCAAPFAEREQRAKL
jgi:hypothetical protein